MAEGRGGPFKGTKIRYTSEATPPTVVLNQIKSEFTEPTGIEVEIEIVPLEQVLAKATQDVQGQLGTYDLYYLDQSWVATFGQDSIDPVQYYKDKPDLAMPGFDFDDFSKPLVEGLAAYEGKWVGIPFDIPIFMTMYRQDILEKHGIKVPTTLDEFTDGGEADHRGREGQRHVRHRPPGQVRPLLAELRLDPDGVERWRLDLRLGQEVQRQRRSRPSRGLQWYQDLLKNAPAAVDCNSTWDGQLQMMASGQCALVAVLG